MPDDEPVASHEEPAIPDTSAQVPAAQAQRSGRV